MLREKMSFRQVRTDRTGAVVCRATTARLSAADRLGSVLVRMDIGRNDYTVEPGLHACGKPGRASPVLVTANYKLSFDSVRKELAGLDVWILVLDTHGVNVWCAAGKGTFGTDELLARIRSSNLARTVAHRDLILPQLGASGIAGYRIARESGFRVHFGPVYARDIPEYLAQGLEKTDRMREVRFGLRDRLVLAPVEIAHAAKFALPAAAAALLLALPSGSGYAQRALLYLGSLAGALVAGTVLFPALLPVLPFRAFAAKGALLGSALAAGAVMLAFRAGFADTASLVSAALMVIPLVAFLSMNFTGSSTFTCQKGTELEVGRAVPPMIVSLAGGTAVAIAGVIARTLGH